MATMVGRDRELAAVVRSLTAPEVALTLVVGEAGIGKSRLVAETVQATPERLTLAGACLPMRHALPLLPVVDALDSRDPAARRALTRAARSLPGPLRPHIAGVMPRTLPDEIRPAEEVRRDQLFLATEALLSRVADERPVTLVVEDVHWADPDTLDLLTYLAGTRHGTALHMLVTCRSEETQMSELVTGWLDTLPRSSGVDELRLEPLGSDEVRRLVASLPHREGVDLDRLAAAVFARGEGNPFFTEAGRLWCGRRATASPSGQAALRTGKGSLASRPGSHHRARRPRATGPDGGTQGCHPPRRGNVPLRSQGARLGLPGRARRPRSQTTACPGRRGASGRAARVPRGVPPAGRNALDPWTTRRPFPRSPTTSTAPATSLLSWQRPSQRPSAPGNSAHTPTPRAGTSASSTSMACIPTSRSCCPSPRSCAAPCAHSICSGARREATALAERAVDSFADWPNTVDRLTLLSYCAQLVSIEDPERGLSMMENLLPYYDGLAPHRDHAATLYRISSQHLSRGDSRTALSIAEQACAIARATGDLQREASTLARMSGCLRRLGDREAADRVGAEALEVAERCGDGATLTTALINQSDNHLKYNEYDFAAAAAERGIEVADQQGLRHSFHAQLLVCNAAEAYLALGRTEEVGRLVDAVTDELLRPDDDLLSDLRAHADLRRGDPSGGLERVRGASGRTGRNAELSRVYAESLAYMLLWNCRPAEALTVAEACLPVASVGDWSQETGLLLSLGARAVADLAEHGGTSSAEAMTALDELQKGMALNPFADRDTLPRATADRRQWQAERTRAEGKSDPDAWTDAASVWESLSMPHDAAYCWWRAAEALLATGADKADLRVALHAAHRLSEGHLPLRDEVGKVATRARIPILEALETDTTPAGDGHLTAQEAKVLRLLATGLTNAEIGTALFISPKTVSVHVTHLLRKLEVSNRTEAATWANRHGLVADP